MKSIDIFGDSISFTARNGDSNFKTWLGALITLFLYFLVVFYSTRRFVVMINREDTKFGESTAGNAQNVEEEAKHLEDLDISLAFRLL